MAAREAPHRRGVRRAKVLRRTSRVDGRELVNFCSNDYLGLARDPRLTRAMHGRRSLGRRRRRGASGHRPQRRTSALEEELAAFTGREAALLFSTGYMANLGAISALAGRGENRRAGPAQPRLAASTARGCRARGCSATGTRMRRMHAVCCEQAGAQASVLIAPTVCSAWMATSRRWRELRRCGRGRDAWLLVDDAHGLGVLGATGRGALELAGLGADDVPLLVGTLGKALGCFGAFVAGDRDLIELILQRARSYIYTTALPPAVAAATRAALRIADAKAGAASA